MEKVAHRLSEIDADARRAVCSVCGPASIRSNGAGRGWKCNWYRNAHRRERRKPYVVHKGDQCEECGFLPRHPRQLDVHHLDGDHSNNDPSNLQTICANCHRLVHA